MVIGCQQAFRKVIIPAILAALASPAASAGWSMVDRYVHRTGKCGGMRKVLASHYTGTRVTWGSARFNPGGDTASSRDYPLGTTITVRNRHNVCIALTVNAGRRNFAKRAADGPGYYRPTNANYLPRRESLTRRRRLRPSICDFSSHGSTSYPLSNNA